MLQGIKKLQWVRKEGDCEGYRVEWAQRISEGLSRGHPCYLVESKLGLLDYSRFTEPGKVKLCYPELWWIRKESTKERLRYVLSDADSWHPPPRKRWIPPPPFFPPTMLGIKSWVLGILSKCPVTEVCPSWSDSLLMQTMTSCHTPQWHVCGLQLE